MPAGPSGAGSIYAYMFRYRVHVAWYMYVALYISATYVSLTGGNVTLVQEVATGEALQSAILSNTRAIVVTEHLDVRRLAAPLAVIEEDMSIWGECDSNLPDWIPDDLEPPLLPLRPGQCLIYTDDVLLHVRSSSYARVTIDHLYIRLQQYSTLTTYVVDLTTFYGASVWIANVTMQGDQGMHTAIVPSNNAALHVSDSTFANFNNTGASLVFILRNSSTVFEGCTIANITTEALPQTSWQPDGNASKPAVWVGVVTARTASAVLVQNCTLSNVPEPFFGSYTTSAGVFYADMPLQMYEVAESVTSRGSRMKPSLDAALLEIRPAAGTPFLRAEDRPSSFSRDFVRLPEAVAGVTTPLAQDSSSEIPDSDPLPSDSELEERQPPSSPQPPQRSRSPAQLRANADSRSGLETGVIAGAAVAVATAVLTMAAYIVIRIRKNRNQHNPLKNAKTDVGGQGRRHQSSSQTSRTASNLRDSQTAPVLPHVLAGQRESDPLRPDYVEVRSSFASMPAPGLLYEPALRPHGSWRQHAHLESTVQSKSSMHMHGQAWLGGRATTYNLTDLRQVVTTSITTGTSWSDYERAAIRSRTPLDALEVALDALCGMQEPLYGRYMICSSMQRRVGGQGLVQFATIRHREEKVAIKFYMDKSAFERESDLYQDPQLKSMMPATLAIEENTSGEICTPYGYCFPPFVIIERGQSLDEWAEANRNADFITIFQALIHSVRTLQKMHSVGYAHRDIKPGNILRRYKEHDWTLIDFGCSALIGTTAKLAFSLKYAPPEVMLAMECGCTTITVDAAADMWAIGVIAYELLTGERAFPFEGLSREEAEDMAQAAIAGRTLLPWEAGSPGRSMRLQQLRGLKRFVLRCLDRDPGKRPTADILLESWNNTFDDMYARDPD